MDREAELRVVERLRRGEEAAFDAAYEEHRARIFTFFLRMVGRREVAEELGQETWLRLATRAASLREDTRLGPWLFTVARNLCVSYWRTRGVEGFCEASQELLESLPGTGASPERGAEWREIRERLERGIVRLPIRYRESLLLVGVEGMAPADAAAVCGTSPEAMRKRLERARDLLAAELGLPRSHASRK